MMAIVFGSPEANELVVKAKELGMALAPDETALAIVAERVWDMVIYTYVDNVDADSYQSAWHEDMVAGIIRVLKGWRP